MPMGQIPLIDISPLYSRACDRSGDSTDRKLAAQLGQAFHHTGFVGVTGHQIPRSLIVDMRAQLTALFALPMQEKMALQVRQGNYRGYIPLGFFSPNAGKQKADQYEGYKLHFETDVDDPIINNCDLYGPNVWPSSLTTLRETTLRYWGFCDELTLNLLGLLAEHLNMPSHYFTASFNQPLSNMTLLRYPPIESNDDSFGIHPHKDTDALTILAPDPIGGLFLRPTGSAQWIDAQVPDDALLVNVGDMLETWSSGYFMSTPHKVINHTGRERLSFPYFAVPRFDVMVEPLLPVNKDVQFPRALAGDISREIWHSNWPDAAPIDKQYDPYTH